MKPGAIIFGVFMSGLLAATAVVLYSLAESGGERHYSDSIEYARQIQVLSADWSVDLARVRSDPLADFDSLASFTPRMASLKDGLSNAARRIPDLPDRLTGDVAAYLSTIDEQEERIERFKTGYAVVRNSARYLPLAADNVAARARAAGDGALARVILDLTRDMGLYLERPNDAAARSALTARMEGLRVASVAYPPALANALANLLAHAEVLIARQAPTEQLFLAATSTEISDLSNQLATDLQSAFGEWESRAVWYERGMLGAVGALALFWILFATTRQQTQRTAKPVGAEVGNLTYRGVAMEEEGPAFPPSAPAFPPPPLVEPAERESEDRAGDLHDAAPAPPTLSAEHAMARGFVAEYAARSFARSADRITEDVDRLRQAQEKIHGVLQNADDALDGAGLGEEMDMASTVVTSVRREANGIADLAKRLASFSRPPDGGERTEIDINECIDDVVEALDAERVAAVTRKPGELPPFLASRTEIRLLLAKVVENAMSAVEWDEKGAIRIDTTHKNGDILITVIDNGVGITADRSRKIFTPFYTSRDGAMGVGLTLADHLVKKYDGSIRINSLPGQGTVTRITLPVEVSAS